MLVQRSNATAAAPPASVAEEARQVIAFIEDEATAAALRSGLAPLGDGLDLRRGSLRHAIRFFRTLAPVHAAVIDISGAEELQPELEELARTCPPEVQVFLIGENTDIGFYRLLVHELGASDYMPKPLTRDVVQRLLLPRLSGAQPEMSDARTGRIIAFCSARGGAGATTIAVNAALLLANMGQKHAVGQAVLLDLNVQNGSAAMMLGARPGTGLRIALEQPERSDALFLERAAIVVNPRLQLIAAEDTPDPPPVTPEGVVHVLDVLRRRFNFVFVDVPIPLPPEMREIWRLVRHVVVVFQPDLPSLRDAQAIRQAAALAAGEDRALLVLNRADGRGALKRELVVRGLGKEPDIVIPNLGPRMIEAVNIGTPALNHVPALRRHLLPLVQELAGINDQAARARTGWLGRWLRRRARA
jgi:pilus assembly protein CpaE